MSSTAVLVGDLRIRVTYKLYIDILIKTMSDVVAVNIPVYSCTFRAALFDLKIQQNLKTCLFLIFHYPLVATIQILRVLKLDF